MSALNKKSFLTYLKEGGIYVVLLVLLAIIIFQDPTFLSLLNLSNILTQSSVRIIIALGVAGLIVTQGTDLSAGRQVGLAAVIAATMLQAVDNANKVFPEMATMPIPLVILLVCAIGAVIGLINGIIIAYLNVTPFITTLGTMIIVYGINSLYYDFVGASPISGFDSHFSQFAQGFIALGSFRLSYITFYALIAVFFVWILWNKTRFGKNIFAIGGNPEAAKVSGVNVALNRLRGRRRIVQRRRRYRIWRGDRGDNLHRHQLRSDLYRREPVLAVHYQRGDYHLRRGAGFAEVCAEEVTSSE